MLQQTQFPFQREKKNNSTGLTIGIFLAIIVFGSVIMYQYNNDRNEK
jgi:hypothetical protein